MAQNSSIIHDITSIAQCKSQQNILTTEIKIKISNKKYLRNKSVLKTVNSHNGALHVSQRTNCDVTILCVCYCVTAILGVTK